MTDNKILNFIDGQYTEGTSGKTFEDRSPATNQLVGTVYEASQADVDAAIKAAQRALDSGWAEASMEERTELMYRVADLIDKRLDDFVQAEINDTGKPVTPTSKGELPRGADTLRVFADSIKNYQHPEPIETKLPDGRVALNYQQHVPKGVIACIVPWNLPFAMATWKIAPALACGNTVVVKPSEETPASITLLGEVMNEAGVPPGVFNVVHGFGVNSAGEFLTQHEGVAGITFTGETRTGAAIMKEAAAGLRNVSLELGGKNPSLVFADCDLDQAIHGSMLSAFLNCGQICLGTERIYVERSIFDSFVEGLKQKAEELNLGDPWNPGTTMGPLSSLKHREKALGYLEQAKDDGATIVTGGGIPEMSPELAEGAWLQPTVLTGLGEDAAIVREEVFGPVCHIQPFDTEEEAIRMANDTEYGLSATVWAEKEHGYQVLSKINAGVCWVNGWCIRDLRTPFGGFGLSGIGREGGIHGLEFYTELKNICVVQ